MRVALDAMGAEKGVGIVIKGALGAIQENSQIEVSIVGDKENLSKYFHYFHAVIDDSDQPLMQEKLQKFDEALRISPINCYGESQPTIEY